MIAWWLIHTKELLHDLAHLVAITLSAWLYQKHETLKEVLEGTLERRHHIMELADILKYQAALPEFKTWLEATMALVEKVESINAGQPPKPA